jgi:hypothetical protein
MGNEKGGSDAALFFWAVINRMEHLSNSDLRQLLEDAIINRDGYDELINRARIELLRRSGQLGHMPTEFKGHA